MLDNSIFYALRSYNVDADADDDSYYVQDLNRRVFMSYEHNGITDRLSTLLSFANSSYVLTLSEWFYYNFKDFLLKWHSVDVQVISLLKISIIKILLVYQFDTHRF